jgi:hypothetical protein
MRTLLRIIAMVVLTVLMLSLTKCSSGKSDKTSLWLAKAQNDLTKNELRLTVL